MPAFNLIIKTLETAARPGALKAALSWNYFSAASFQLVSALNKTAGDLRTILDVGANRGQFAVACANFYPQAVVHSFEPMPSALAKLRKNAAQHCNITAHPFALGAKTGAVKFYENEYSHASSMLPIHANQKELFPKTARTRLIEIPVKTLDSLAAELDLEPPVLLKMDVQGYEKEVLKGAVDSLAMIDWLLFETSFLPMYEGEPLFAEMHEFVCGLGFKLVAPLAVFCADDGRVAQMDVLYKKQ